MDADTLQGATWASPLAIGSTTPAAGTFTTLIGALRDSGGQVFNVTAPPFNAAMNGTTDDTAALQAALTAAGAAAVGGGLGATVYLPPGSSRSRRLSPSRPTSRWRGRAGRPARSWSRPR